MHTIKTAWNKWRTIAYHIGVFQSRVILTLFYFILLFPIGIVFSFFKDELEMKSTPQSTWKKKEKQPISIAELKEQF